MTEYCTRTNVTNRLTAQGIKYLVDRDLDGTAEEDELAEYVDVAIEESGVVIDEHIHHFIKPSVARAAANVWLRMICTDLTVERLSRLGGGEPSASIVFDAERARIYLADVKAGRRLIPNLTLTAPNEPTGYEVPNSSRVVNP